MTEAEDGTAVYESVLSRPEDTPTRYALAMLAGSDRFWSILVIGLPGMFVALSWFHPLFASVAVGLPVVTALYVVWMSHEFIDCKTRIDRSNSTIAKTKPYSEDYYGAVTVDEISSVSIIQFPTIALVNIGYENSLSIKTPSVIVDATDVETVETDLEAMGIDVSTRRQGISLSVSSSIDRRVWGTPVAIVGTLLLVGGIHGVAPFRSNAFVIATVILICYVLYGVRYRSRLDRTTA